MPTITRFLRHGALALGLLFLAPVSGLAAEPEALLICQTCHGRDGVASSPEQANLAGQHKAYLGMQLRAYRSGARKNPVMSGMAAGLSDTDIDALATWYSAQAPVSAANGPPELVDLGQQRAGYCHGCHGMQGVPVADEWPVLAGQSAVYLQAQLHAFRSGTRQHPLMQPVVRRLGDRDIEALAAYYAQLKRAVD